MSPVLLLRIYKECRKLEHSNTKVSHFHLVHYVMGKKDCDSNVAGFFLYLFYSLLWGFPLTDKTRTQLWRPSPTKAAATLTHTETLTWLVLCVLSRFFVLFCFHVTHNFKYGFPLNCKLKALFYIQVEQFEIPCSNWNPIGTENVNCYIWRKAFLAS